MTDTDSGAHAHPHRPPIRDDTWLPLAFGRMPGWAIALATAFISTCVAVLAVVLVLRDQAQHRQDSYENCLAQKQSSVLVLDIFGDLREADNDVLEAVNTGKAEPVTDFGKVDVASIRQRVDAYDRLLELATQGKQVDCSKLR